MVACIRRIIELHKLILLLTWIALTGVVKLTYEMGA